MASPKKHDAPLPDDVEGGMTRRRFQVSFRDVASVNQRHHHDSTSLEGERRSDPEDAAGLSKMNEFMLFVARLVCDVFGKLGDVWLSAFDLSSLLSSSSFASPKPDESFHVPSSLSNREATWASQRPNW